MRLTQYTDYALRALIYMALQPDRVCTISEIADAYRISRNHLLKIALVLRDMGVIETVRGRSGGVRLLRTPAEINLGEVVRITEPDFSFAACMRQGGTCIISPACKLRTVLTEALDEFLAVLDGYTLADIVQNRTALSSLLKLTDNGKKRKSKGKTK